MPTNRSRIVAKATDDDQFRQQLKSDPRGTVERETGAAIPADLEITVLEETRDHVYIVLPSMNPEMSKDELEQLTGGAAGMCYPWCWTSVCSA